MILESIDDIDDIDPTLRFWRRIMVALVYEIETGPFIAC